MQRLHHHGGDLETKGRIDILANMSGHDEERLVQLISNHYMYTGSTRAKDILDNWQSYRTKFVKVMPVEYRRALQERPDSELLKERLEIVNRHVPLRRILADRDGSPLGVTLLSSDMGKLYVALAQAIDRLRT